MSLVKLVVKEVVLVSYAPKLAAALSGATIRQLAYWRKPGPDGRPVLTPEYSASRPIDYSFRDVIALRTCVRLRQEASLQKIRRALDALRIDDSEHAVDLVRQRGNLVIHQFVEVLQPFYVQGRQIPALLEPREHVQVDPGVRGGEPVFPAPGFLMTRLPR
jgi:DNA-binding transcriptional MerR regulator